MRKKEISYFINKLNRQGHTKIADKIQKVLDQDSLSESFINSVEAIFVPIDALSSYRSFGLLGGMETTDKLEELYTLLKMSFEDFLTTPIESPMEGKLFKDIKEEVAPVLDTLDANIKNCKQALSKLVISSSYHTIDKKALKLFVDSKEQINEELKDFFIMTLAIENKLCMWR